MTKLPTFPNHLPQKEITLTIHNAIKKLLENIHNFGDERFQMKNRFGTVTQSVLVQRG